jgi:single-strand DNA-binding protein
MSISLNKVILKGHLGTDVKSYKFDNGDMLANFSMATSEFYVPKGKTEKIEATEWHKVVVRNKLAENCEKHLSKGDYVLVEGKIHTNKWEDEGVTKYNTEIVAFNVDFLKTSKKSEQEVDEEAAF